MPRANIYIRQENWDYWTSLDNKSEHVNFWLLEDKQDALMVKEHIVREGIALKIIPPKPEKNFNFCKHDQVKGMCKRGCK